MEILTSNFHYIHSCVTPSHDEKWYFSMIYVNPDATMKANMLGQLVDFTASLDHPWLVVGDMNDIREPYEKSGGAPFNWS